MPHINYEMYTIVIINKISFEIEKLATKNRDVKHRKHQKVVINLIFFIILIIPISSLIN